MKMSKDNKLKSQRLCLFQADEVSISAFHHCQWYLPNIIPIRRSLMITIHRSQRPVGLSAGGLMDINRQTVISVSI